MTFRFAPYNTFDPDMRLPYIKNKRMERKAP